MESTAWVFTARSQLCTDLLHTPGCSLHPCSCSILSSLFESRLLLAAGCKPTLQTLEIAMQIGKNKAESCLETSNPKADSRVITASTHPWHLEPCPLPGMGHEAAPPSLQ